MEYSDKPKNQNIGNNNKDKIEKDECASKINNETNNDQAGANNEAAEQNANNITPSNAELMKQLGVLNLSLNTLYVILLAVILNINFVKYERAKLLDQINKTNLSKNLPDLSDTPRVTNIMFLYSTGVFLDINYNAFKEVSSVKGKNRNPKAIRRAWKSLLSTILTFIATAISRDNLEL